MTLEDQIRRLGDARAEKVAGPEWRERPGGNRGRGLLAAAAAALVIVGAMSVWMIDDDDPDVDTTNETVPTSSAAASTSTASPTSTVPAPDPTVDPSGGSPCASNPEPSAEVLDEAVHLGPDATPLDLDQDGIDDELLAYLDTIGNWSLIARLQTGWTAAGTIGHPSVPELAMRPDGGAAGADLDGDGQLEFFVTGYGFDGDARLVSLAGCEIRNGARALDLGLGFPDDSQPCAGDVCFTRVTCDAGLLVYETLISADPPAAEGDVVWETVEIRLRDGWTTRGGAVDSTRSLTAPPGPIPAGAPTAETTGVIDCAP